MVAQNPPSLSFTALNTVLRCAHVAEADAKKLLEDHKQEIFKALRPSETENLSQDASEIRYRAGAKTTESHPKPSAAELICIESMKKSLGLSQSNTALLLRDFLLDMHGASLSDFLTTCEDLTEVVSITTLGAFWTQEKRHAFSCLVTSMICATSPSDHPLKAAFDSFLEENRNTIQEIVIQGTVKVLTSLENAGKTRSAAGGHNFDSWWFMELLFVYSKKYGIEPTDQMKLLEAFSRLVKESRESRPGGANPSGGSAVQNVLGDDATSVLFVAALNHSNDLGTMIAAVEQVTSGGNMRDMQRQPKLSQNQPAVQGLNELLVSLEQFPVTETAALAFSWSAFLRLQEQISLAEDETETNSESNGSITHMTYALTSNVFTILRIISDAKLETDELVLGALYHCLWLDVCGFLTAFPPQGFTPSQVEEIVELAANILNRCDLATTAEISEGLWNHESSGSGFLGANILLRLASSLYPQTFRPLVLLLTSLTFDSESASRAIDYLENRLMTLTEASEGYHQSLKRMDDSEGDIWESYNGWSQADIEFVSRILTSSCPGEEEGTIMVRAMEDLPESLYRPVLSKNTFGLANTSATVVTWVVSWNGLGALDHILRILLQLLGDHSSGYEEFVLTELLASAQQTLKFVDRVCRLGSADLRNNLIGDTEQLSVVARIVSELADPGDWVQGSWLTKKRRGALLSSSASCLSSMVRGSQRRAQFSLEQVSSSKTALPLHAALSSLGQAAFPAVAAISQIAALSMNPRGPFETIFSASSAARSLQESSMTNNSDSYRSSPRESRVYKFLRTVALPLWLTASAVSERNQESRSLHWMLPACGIHLLSACPADILTDAAVPSVIATILLAATNTALFEVSDDRDVFLFPALRTALVACHEALRSRNAALQEELCDSSHNEVPGSFQTSSPSRTTSELTALEKQLMKPDVMHAMALLSSSSVEKLKRESFYTQWLDSTYRSFLPEFNDGEHLYLNGMSLDDLQARTNIWQTWSEDMSTRCLSLLFCCLSKLSGKSNIPQVPWPTMDRSAFGKWREGGEGIRKCYAKKISDGKSLAAVELMTSVLSCGQRAAARSLMGPRPKTAKLPSSSLVASASPNSNQKKSDSVPTTEPSTQAMSVEVVERENEVMFAATQALCCSRDSWVSKVGALDSQGDVERRGTMRDLGRLSLNMATLVRFLTVGWELHSSKWFRECWVALNIWDLLASLLQCESHGSRMGKKVDLGKALELPYEWLKGTSNETEEVFPLDSDCSVWKIGLTVDIHSAWVGIAADIMQVFSSEILFRASEALAHLQAAPGSGTDAKEGKEIKLSADLFKEQLFTSFGAVFSERWMYSLLQDTSLFDTESPSIETPSLRRTNLMSVDGVTDQSAGVETLSRELGTEIALTIGIDDKPALTHHILFYFRRVGDMRLRFGADYFFDVPLLLKCLKALNVEEHSLKKIVSNVIRLNAMMGRKDVEVDVVSAYSAMASTVLFADAFAPAPGVALTYSSPQFGGKLCRFLSRVLVYGMSSIADSTHTITNVCEIAKLMASLSARLTPEELDQAALTAVKFAKTPPHVERESTLSPLGQICFTIDRILANLSSGSREEYHGARRLATLQWLLLTASRFARGSAFKEEHDVTALAKSAISSLRVVKDVPSISAAASVAISTVLEILPGPAVDLAFASDSINITLSSIASLAKEALENRQERLAAEAAGNLLLSVARIHCSSGRNLNSTKENISILRHLSSGSILSFLPPEHITISTYDSSGEYRNPVHMVWCSVLQLAASVIGDDVHSTRGRDQRMRDILEFCTTNLLRIVRDSLNLSGDWPPAMSSTGVDGQGGNQLETLRHLTISRVEEAELAAGTLFQLSRYALLLQHNLTELLSMTVSELIRYVYQVYRLIRAEPVERWVRPVTPQEKNRSILLRSDRESSSGGGGLNHGGSPWAMSPSSSGNLGSATPPRRSPSQALRAAIGGGNRSSGYASAPPSPGMPPTPLSHSPMSVGTGTLTGGPGSNSPTSPWGPHGSGLITSANLHFGEEAYRSLLRGLNSALGALRRLSSQMDVLFFSPSMMLSEDKPGLGVLVAIQYHACNEIQRGADGERRASLQMILDNALHMIMTHVATYSEQGALTQGVKDELRKRAGTVVSRMRKVVPPAPSFSVVYAKELDAFWQQLR